MVLAAATTWEIRSGGNDANGGGYVTGASGTDWSLQNSPQYALTGIATAGAGAVFLYVGASADMVGNILQVVSGTNFTAGFYQILSVSLGVSVTVDRNLCTGIGASGVINIGGAVATVGAIGSVVVDGNIVYVKKAAFTITTAWVLSWTGFVSIRGYDATRGDNGRPTVTTSTNSTSVFSGIVFGEIQNFIFTTTASVKTTLWALAGSGGQGRFINCSITDWTSPFGTNNGDLSMTMVNCYLANSSITLMYRNVAMYLDGCTIKNCGNQDQDRPSTWIITGCIFDSMTAPIIHNVDTGAGQIPSINFSGNTVYNQTGSALDITVNNGNPNLFVIIQNNLFYTVGAYGIAFNSAALTGLAAMFAKSIRNNAYGSMTSGNTNNAALDGPNDVNLSADPFTAKSAGDFSLNATVGGGAACKAAGFPGVFPGGLTTGYLDIGAAQSAAGGGSSGMLFIPNLEGT